MIVIWSKRRHIFLKGSRLSFQEGKAMRVKAAEVACKLQKVERAIPQVSTRTITVLPNSMSCRITATIMGRWMVLNTVSMGRRPQRRSRFKPRARAVPARLQSSSPKKASKAVHSSNSSQASIRISCHLASTTTKRIWYLRIRLRITEMRLRWTTPSIWKVNSHKQLIKRL